MLLDIIHQLKELVPRSLQLHGVVIRDAHELQRIVEEPAFDILILYASNLDLAIYPLKLGSAVII